MDGGMATVMVAGLVGVAGAILGALGQYWLGRQARAEARRQQLADDADRRIREWNVRRIDETRQNLAEVFDAFAELTERNGKEARQLLRSARRRLLANAELVGDADALRAGADAVARILQKVPQGIVRRTIMQFYWPLGDPDRRAISKARSLIVRALVEQEERALRDEPLKEFSLDEAAEIMAILSPAGETGDI